MSLIKILIVSLAISLLVMWWKRSLTARIRKEYDDEEPRRHKNMPTHQEMVRCHHCDVYIPLGEAVKSRNLYYCSKEHYKKGS